MNLIPVSEIIDLAKKRGIYLGRGTPQNRIAYFVKLGLIPHAVRKTNLKTGRIEAHFPPSILENIEDINHAKRKNVSHQKSNQVDEVVVKSSSRFLVAGLLVLVFLFGITTLFTLFKYSPLPHQAVLGIETFVAPVVSEEGPLGGVLSQAGRIIGGLTGIFKGGSLVVPLLGKSELETPADLNVQGKAHVASDIEGLGNLKIKGTATVGKLVTGIVDPYLIENDGTVQSTLEIKTQPSSLGSADIVFEPGGLEKLRVKEGGPVTVSTNLNISGGETIGGNISFSSTSPVITIGDTGTLKITDGINTLLTLSDGGTIGNLKVTGTIEGSNISSGAKVSGTNTGDQTITLTGDVTGSGTGSFATTLGTSGVTAASYGSTTAIPVLTVDAKGRITGATTAALSSTPAWSSLSNPTANLSLSMSSFTTTFTYNAATGASTNLFNLTDTTNNTGTGYLMNISTAAGSSLKPFHVQTTGSIDAITVLANGTTGIGTNSPGSQLQINPSSTTTIGEIIKAQASQTADLLQIQNSLAGVIAKVDNLGNLTANTLTSTVSTGTAPLTVTSTTQVTNLNASTLGGNTAATISPVMDVQVFTANGTWTKPANAKIVHVIAIGAGAGGTGGQGGAAGTDRGGGFAGGGGAFVERIFDPSVLGATETVTIGAGSAGSGSGIANANNTNPGGNTSFGSHMTAYGGGGARGVNGNEGGGGGGESSAGNTSAPGGPHASGLTGPNYSDAGGAQGCSQVNCAGPGNAWLGGGGGGGGQAAASAGNTTTGQGGSSMRGGAGGGGGGGVLTSNVESVGGAGGSNGLFVNGGGGVAGTTAGGSGGNGTSRSGTGKAGDGGGGGGGNASGTGGNGGNGGIPGGGGGAGGGGTSTGGTGGAGARGEVIVYTFGKNPLADLAEEYKVSDISIEAGDVVKLISDPQIHDSTLVGKTGKGYDREVLGIISTNPSIILGDSYPYLVNLNFSDLDRYKSTNIRPVALSGRVPVKVTNENGPIHRGDTLTSSEKYPGFAMRATKAGRSIGVAMEDFNPTTNEQQLTTNPLEVSSQQSNVQLGKIMTFVNLSWYDPDVYLTDSGSFVIDKVSEQPTATLVSSGTGSSYIIATQSATPVQTQNNNTYTLTNSQTKETIDRVGGYNNLFVANLKVGSLDVSTITNDKLKNLELRLKNLELATGSAVLSASISGLLNEQQSSSSAVLSSLTISKKLLTTDLGITGSLTQGLLTINGLDSLVSTPSATINTIGDLYFQNLSAGGINFLNGKVLIDKNGNLTVLNTITAQKIEADIFSSTKASGSSILPANTASIDVISQNATDSARILVTPTTLTDKVLTITNKTVGKFTVSVKAVDSQDIHFDWFIVN